MKKNGSPQNHLPSANGVYRDEGRYIGLPLRDRWYFPRLAYVSPVRNVVNAAGDSGTVMMV